MNKKGNRGYRVETYIGRQRRVRPSIKESDYEEWNQIQYNILFDEKNEEELDLMIQTYRAWDEDRGEDFHRLVGKMRAQFRV